MGGAKSLRLAATTACLMNRALEIKLQLVSVPLPAALVAAHVHSQSYVTPAICRGGAAPAEYKPTSILLMTSA